MRKNVPSGLALAIVALMIGASPVLAHGPHCHLKSADGKSSDAPALNTEKACTEKGGTWQMHHAHCHLAGSDGKLADMPEAKTQDVCAAKGGKWMDHAPDGSHTEGSHL